MRNTQPAMRGQPPSGSGAPGGEYYPGAAPYDGGPLEGSEFGWANGAPACDTCGPCMGLPCGIYSRVDYLLWGTKGMSVPALVTTSPPTTARADAGVLGVDGTAVLFGTGTVNSNARSGARVLLGGWLDGCQKIGVEADYFALSNEVARFNQGSNGVTILARPFYDVVQGVESSELVAFPNVLRGAVDVAAETRFQGAGFRLVYNLCCGQNCGPSCFSGCPVNTQYRYDFLIGYRFLRLDDSLDISERLTSLDTSAPGSFVISDRFQSENQFHGIDLGTAMHFRRGCWSLDVLTKMALGNVHSVVNINGSTMIDDDGDTSNNVGGLLAQRTNIGRYRNDDFAMVPELGFTAGYQLNPCWRVTAGYNFLYWSRVFRAGDHIDRDVNTALLPPENPVATTHLRPEFRGFACDDFWAQGLTLGLESNW